MFYKEKYILSLFKQSIPGITIRTIFTLFMEIHLSILEKNKKSTRDQPITAPVAFTNVLQTGITTIKLMDTDQ